MKKYVRARKAFLDLGHEISWFCLNIAIAIEDSPFVILTPIIALGWFLPWGIIASLEERKNWIPFVLKQWRKWLLEDFRDFLQNS